MSEIPSKVPEDLDRALLDAAAKVLYALGWHIGVIGGLRIEQRPESEHHFQIAVKFTGSRPKSWSAPSG